MDNKSQSSLGFFGIFRESIKTTYRNRKLLLPILLFSFLSLSHLQLYQDYIQLPFLEKILWQLTEHHGPFINHNLRHKLDLMAYRGALDDILETLFLKQLTIALSSIINLFFCVATVSSSYTSKVIGLKEMFLKIRTSFKNALITSFCLFLTYSGIIFVYLACYGMINIVFANSWSYLISGAITFSTPFCYLYVTSLLMVSMVVSVFEEGFGGFRAIGRAIKLMNGKRIQASVLMVPFVIVGAYCHNMVYAFSSFHMRRSRWLAMVIYWTVGSGCLLNLFMFVVYTVFYCEQKTCLEKKEVKKSLHHRPIGSGEA